MAQFIYRHSKLQSLLPLILSAVFLLALAGRMHAQATVPVTRSAWSTTPTGWSDNQGTNPTYGTDICGGSDATSGRLDNTGENFVVNYGTGASSLSFCVQGNGFTAGGIFSVEESVNGTAWTTVQTYTTLTTASSKTLTLSCLSRYVRFIYTLKSGGNVQLDNVSITQGICSVPACTEPLVNASGASTASASCSGFNISWTSGSGDGRLVIVKAGSAPTSPTDGVVYTANPAYGSGSSVGGGSAVYSGAANTVSVSGTSPSVTYYYSIYEYNATSCTGINYLTTGLIAGGSVTTPTCPICPHLTGAFINACDGSCSEGDNEIMFLNSGTYSIPVSPANIKVYYGTTAALSTSADNFTESFTTSPSIINNLNTLAGCGTLFYDASAVGTIPAGKVFMVMRSTACFNFDFSSFCGSGPIYVLFSTDPSWTVGGNFANSGAAGVLRYFKTDFSAVSAGCVASYNYEPNQLVGGDGAGVSFPDAGGAASSYYNAGCSPPTIILPLNLVDFYATQNGDENELFWKVSSEANIRNYIVEKSANGHDFSPLSTVSPHGSEQGMDYSTRDLSPYEGITYYRLSTAEGDGSIKTYRVIYADRQSKDWKSVIYQQDNSLVIEFKNYLPKSCTYTLMDLSGRPLCSGSLPESMNNIDISGISAGIYFVSISTPYKAFNTKIVIQR